VDAQLFYIESGIIYSQTIGLLSFRGMLNPDHLRKIGLIHELLDGSITPQIRGFNKIIEPKVSTNTSEIQRRFLANWISSDDKSIAYGIGTVNPYVSEVVNDKDLVSDWLYDLEYGREFSLELVDTHVYKHWEDGITSDDLMYLKRDVQITGTVAVPETLVTGSNPLSVMENGNPWPSFSSVTHDFLVAVNADKGCEASFGIVKGSVAVVAGNLMFDIFVSDFGQAAPDGKYYACIAIFLQAK
jgi:hypothetical protein